jgi:hypothetical protein
MRTKLTYLKIGKQRKILYAVSTVVAGINSKTAITGNITIATSVNKKQLKADALKKAKIDYPEKEGWELHQARIFPIPADVLREETVNGAKYYLFACLLLAQCGTQVYAPSLLILAPDSESAANQVFALSENRVSKELGWDVRCYVISVRTNEEILSSQHLWNEYPTSDLIILSQSPDLVM